MVRFVTDRLSLEPIELSHIDDLVELDSDPEVVRYVGGVSSDHERYRTVLMPLMLAWPDAPYGFFAVYPKDARAFLGWFHLRPSVADASMLELGYRLRRSAWGQGFATEGSRALLRHAFFTLNQSEVDACADPANKASTHVMVKCGMKRVGELIHPRSGALVDRYSVRKADVIL